LIGSDDKVGRGEGDVTETGKFNASYADVMASSTATDVITQGLDDTAPIGDTPFSSTHRDTKLTLYDNTKRSRGPKRNPMAAMDAGTPLTPRTRLILGIGPDPSTPTVATETPNTLFGSMEPTSPVEGSPTRDVSGWQLQDQVTQLQADLLAAKHRAEKSERFSQEAKEETGNLRHLVGVLETQVKAMQVRGVGAASHSPGLGSGVGGGGVVVTDPVNSPASIGITVLDVLGLMWLVTLIQGLMGGGQPKRD